MPSRSAEVVTHTLSSFQASQLMHVVRVLICSGPMDHAKGEVFVIAWLELRFRDPAASPQHSKYVQQSTGMGVQGFGRFVPPLHWKRFQGIDEGIL